MTDSNARHTEAGLRAGDTEYGRVHAIGYEAGKRDAMAGHFDRCANCGHESIAHFDGLDCGEPDCSVNCSRFRAALAAPSKPVPEGLHPRTYSLVGAPHLFLVTDDERGINIGYADAIGGPLVAPFATPSATPAAEGLDAERQITRRLRG